MDSMLSRQLLRKMFCSSEKRVFFDKKANLASRSETGVIPTAGISSASLGLRV